MRPKVLGEKCELREEKVRTTNAVCCILAMQYQMGKPLDAACVSWLQQRQDEFGGFYATEEAPYARSAEYSRRLVHPPSRRGGSKDATHSSSKLIGWTMVVLPRPCMMITVMWNMFFMGY